MKHGLKGVTDATVFCKSMQKGGPAPMIRSMKSYELGGMTDTAGEECYEMVQEGAGPPKRRKKKKCPGNKMSTRRYNRSRRVPGL